MISIDCPRCTVPISLKTVVRSDDSGYRGANLVRYVRIYETCRGCGDVYERPGYFHQNTPQARELNDWIDEKGSSELGGQVTAPDPISEENRIRRQNRDYSSRFNGQREYELEQRRQAHQDSFEARVLGRFSSDQPQRQTLSRDRAVRQQQLGRLQRARTPNDVLDAYSVMDDVRSSPGSVADIMNNLEIRADRSNVQINLNREALPVGIDPTRVEQVINDAASDFIGSVNNPRAMAALRSGIEQALTQMHEYGMISVDIETQSLSPFTGEPNRPKGIWAYLKDREVVECEMEEWASGKGDKREVKQTVFSDGTLISTVFLGLNSGMGRIPLWFETMRFNKGGPDDHQERHTTWDEAVSHHDELVQLTSELKGRGVSRGEHEALHLTKPGKRRIILDDQ